MPPPIIDSRSQVHKTVSIGDGSHLRNTHVCMGSNIDIYCLIGSDNRESVFIGNNCELGRNVIVGHGCVVRHHVKMDPFLFLPPYSTLHNRVIYSQASKDIYDSQVSGEEQANHGPIWAAIKDSPALTMELLKGSVSAFRQRDGMIQIFSYDQKLIKRLLDW